jgi:hypothetical protein
MHSVFTRIATCHYWESNPEHRQQMKATTEIQHRVCSDCRPLFQARGRQHDPNDILSPEVFLLKRDDASICPKRSVYTNLAAYKIDITIARQRSTAMRQESLFWEALKINCNGPQCIVHYSVRLRSEQIFLIQHTSFSMELKSHKTKLQTASCLTTLSDINKDMTIHTSTNLL